MTGEMIGEEGKRGGKGEERWKKGRRGGKWEK